MSRISVTALIATMVLGTWLAASSASAAEMADLSPAANSDPLYGYMPNGLFYEEHRNNKTRMIRDGDATLGIEGWNGLAPGLPDDADKNGTEVYTAHMAAGDVDFLLDYGMQWPDDSLPSDSAIKWRGDDGSGTFSRSNTFTLNAGTSFAPGNYSTLYGLSVFTASSGTLTATMTYTDNSTSMDTVNLYNWFGNDGDATSEAVGYMGVLRSVGAIGFRRINSSGQPNGGGGDTGGAFMFGHTFDVDPSKTLDQVTFSTDITSGSLVLLSATLVPEPGSLMLMVLAAGCLLRRRR